MESTSHVENFDGHVMRFRKSDAFINLTTLCKGFPDKPVQDFLRLPATGWPVNFWAAKRVSDSHVRTLKLAVFTDLRRLGVETVAVVFDWSAERHSFRAAADRRPGLKVDSVPSGEAIEPLCSVLLQKQEATRNE